MTEPAIELNGVTKRYGAFTAVKNLSFAVSPGEIYGFLGPNGAGKTSTLRMMLAIIAPTSGSVRVLGVDDARKVRRRIGYLPEERGLYKKMRAADAIAYFARLRGVRSRVARARAHDLLDRFGLAAFAATKCEALSKGMAQKVQLLATIAHEPELLILDEPFSGLDPINQELLEGVIREQRDAGRTIMFSTHVMSHAERLCDRFLIMAQAEKRFEGALHEARAAFAHRLHIITDAPLDVVARAPGVSRAQFEDEAAGKGPRAIVADLEPGGDAQQVLRAIMESGAQIVRFEQGGATLHDIFVALAGEEAPA